jgi:uncharacterized membrane protein (UPF0127 family)
MLLSFAISIFGCRHSGIATNAEEPEVILVPPLGKEVRVRVELARTDEERRRGLMFRQSLQAGHGMLFLFEQAGPLKFWMHNTYIPLDLIFIDSAQRVIYVEENAEPLTDTPRGPEQDSRYVLEVPGGWAKRSGIEAGVQVRFAHIFGQSLAGGDR